jgi:hypothetical protein
MPIVREAPEMLTRPEAMAVVLLGALANVALPGKGPYQFNVQRCDIELTDSVVAQATGQQIIVGAQ